MEETTFAADPMRLMIAAAVGIVILLILIIKFKLHPVLSMMISAIIIGAGAGMPLTMISDTVEKGVGKTLQGIALLVVNSVRRKPDGHLDSQDLSLVQRYSLRLVLWY